MVLGNLLMGSTEMGGAGAGRDCILSPGLGLFMEGVAHSRGRWVELVSQAPVVSGIEIGSVMAHLSSLK